MTPVVDGAATTPPRTVGVQESSPPALLLDPVEAPSLTRSSPHIIPFERFVVAFGHSPHRRELLALIERELQCLQSQGVVALCMLVGGSFVCDGCDPNDFDALVVYRLEQAAGIDALGLMAQRKPDGLDLRFVPGDVGPVPLIKMACFFHTLYQSRDRGGDQPSYLVLLAD